MRFGLLTALLLLSVNVFAKDDVTVGYLGPCKPENIGEEYVGKIEDCTRILVSGSSTGKQGGRVFSVDISELDKFNEGSKLALILASPVNKGQAQEMIGLARTAKSFKEYSDTIINGYGVNEACLSAQENLEKATAALNIAKAQNEHAQKTLSCPMPVKPSKQNSKDTSAEKSGSK